MKHRVHSDVLKGGSIIESILEEVIIRVLTLRRSQLGEMHRWRESNEWEALSRAFRQRVSGNKSRELRDSVLHARTR